VRGDNVRK